MSKIVVVTDPDNERGVRLVALDTGKVLAEGHLVVGAIVPDATHGQFTTPVVFEGQAVGDYEPVPTAVDEQIEPEPSALPAQNEAVKVQFDQAAQDAATATIGEAEAAGGTIGDAEPQE